MTRSYSELIKLENFKDRFDYLKLDGKIGNETFGYDRYMNQVFYRSARWKHIRDLVIARDNGCDLGVEGCSIFGKIIIHHINPVILDDLKNENLNLLNPEYLICTSMNTHNAIHYGDADLLNNNLIMRTKNDTCPWRK